MAEITQDIWSNWLLQRRFGGDQEQLKATIDFLLPIRDRLLNRAGLQDNQLLLDVGCGDGLIGFGALQLNPACRVIFSDISPELLERAKELAQAQGVLSRCHFVRNAAEKLDDTDIASVDIVAIRSVLIYVAAKQEAFHEFYRVLKPGGRLAIFEPINRFNSPEPDHLLWGYEVEPIQEIANKVKTFYRRLQPPDLDPMLNFDERDLFHCAETAGFSEISLEVEAELKRKKSERSWDNLLRTAFNPKLPTVVEALEAALAMAEREAFTAYMRPLYEETEAVRRSAVAYLWAVK
jgi:ubiquinone/menaquinone biosynthesis C-methylase UbiE